MLVRKPRLLLLVLAVGGLLSLALVACGGNTEATSSTKGAEELQVASADTTEPAVLPTEVMEATVPAEPIAESPTQTPAVEEASVKPTPRQELHATNPSRVSLASGQLQLLEFFAYW